MRHRRISRLEERMAFVMVVMVVDGGRVAGVEVSSVEGAKRC